MFSETRMLPLLCALALACGCSVKEERNGCPRVIALDLSEVDTGALAAAGCGAMLVGMRSVRPPQETWEELLDVESLPRVYEMTVPDDSVCLYALAATDFGGISGGELNIPAGEACPGIFSWRAAIPAGRETSVPVTLHKDFCLIDITLERPFPPALSYVAVGGISGATLGGVPREGYFFCPLSPDSGGSCRLSVPRQKDSSLRLMVLENDDAVRYFALGYYMGLAGYDWGAEDLEDISVRVSLAKGSAAFNINLWPKTVILDIVF